VTGETEQNGHFHRKTFVLLPTMKLRSTAQFESVFGFRCSRSNQLMAVHAAPNTIGITRIGLSVSKRVAGGGVMRNRIRRRLREVFRKNRPALPTGFDFVISVRSAKLPVGNMLDSMALDLFAQVILKANRRKAGDIGGAAGE
jgi:ribonuclease P protein component